MAITLPLLKSSSKQLLQTHQLIGLIICIICRSSEKLFFSSSDIDDPELEKRVIKLENEMTDIKTALALIIKRVTELENNIVLHDKESKNGNFGAVR